MKKTKIIATIGPKTRSPSMLKKLIDAGCNVIRINMSHSSQAEAEGIIHDVRELSEEVGIMVDTKGPEVRLTEVNEASVLVNGAEVKIHGKPNATTATDICVNYSALPRVLDVGAIVLVSDGKIELKVTKIEPDYLVCTVTRGGELESKKGVNIPGIKLPMPFLSEQDASDILFAVRQGVDFIAASFVSDESDVKEVRKLIEREDGLTSIIAKIESRYAVDNLKSIIDASDIVMVARGDLGVEISAEEVPIVQKCIIKNCRRKGKAVIVATEMLESMIQNQRPTRAETSDVANSIFEGADAVMLSGETSVGKHPIESIQTIVKIANIAEAEVSKWHDDIAVSAKLEDISELVCKGAWLAARELKVTNILVPTSSGNTAKKMSRYRPNVPILAITTTIAKARLLSLNYGVYAYSTSHYGRMESMIRRCCQLMLDRSIFKNDELIAVICGVPVGRSGSTNLLTIQVVEELMGRGKNLDKDTEKTRDMV
ncbi:MAG: pyruvate kinase [Methylococcales bacterium]|nr:pyruvate kinase [Methylococcales bacterium]